MKAVVLTLFCLAIFIVDVKSQRAVPYELYFQNWKIVNPAATGLGEKHKIDWHGKAIDATADGSPAYGLLSYEGFFDSINSGLGLIIESEEIGITTVGSIQALFSYKLEFSNGKQLSFGTGIGLFMENKDFESLGLLNSDSSSPGSNFKSAMDIDLGVVYKKNSFISGLSFKKILDSEFDYPEYNIYNPDLSYLSLFAQQTFSYSLFEVEPSFYLETDYKSFIGDLNTTFLVADIVLLGGSLRVMDSRILGSAMVGLGWKDLFRLTAIAYSEANKDYSGNLEFRLSAAFR